MRLRSPVPAARPASAAAPTGLAQFGRRGLGKVRRLVAGRPGTVGSTSAASQGLPARRRAMTERLDALATESGRLLVVLEHTRQRVETADGPRDVNPYLSSVVDALRGSALEPIEIDLKARVDDDTWWDAAQRAGRCPPAAVVGDLAGRRRGRATPRRGAGVEDGLSRRRGSPPSRRSGPRSSSTASTSDRRSSAGCRSSPPAGCRARSVPSPASARCSAAFDRPVCSWPTSTTARTG